LFGSSYAASPPKKSTLRLKLPRLAFWFAVKAMLLSRAGMYSSSVIGL
jgi:hypothetical protein